MPFNAGVPITPQMLMGLRQQQASAGRSFGAVEPQMLAALRYRQAMSGAGGAGPMGTSVAAADGPAPAPADNSAQMQQAAAMGAQQYAAMQGGAPPSQYQRPGLLPASRLQSGPTRVASGPLFGRANPTRPPALRFNARNEVQDMAASSMMRKSPSDYNIAQYRPVDDFYQTPNNETNRSIRQLYNDWNKLPGFEGKTFVSPMPSAGGAPGGGAPGGGAPGGGAPGNGAGGGGAAGGGAGPAGNFDPEQIRRLIAQYGGGGVGPMSNLDAGQIQKMVEGMRRGGWPSFERTEL